MEGLDKEKLPQHIAVIMDGNGRWAKKKGASRIFGHNNAVNAVRDTVEGCAELGIKYLTLYAFSTENWARPKAEVDGLMRLLVRTLRGELKELQKNNIRLTSIGDVEELPQDCYRQLKETEAATSENDQMTVILALNYSGRWEIIEAARQLARDVKNGKIVPEEINDTLFSLYLNTSNIPDPELMIRTSGEMRISNFLLWQLAYAELYITDVLWPDFRKEHLHKALLDFQNRERRFGKTSEQLRKQIV